MSWAFRRMLQAFATFLVAVVLMFFLMRLAPEIRSPAWATSDPSLPPR